MFRISHFMHELAQAEATGAYPAPKRRGGEGGALRPHTGPVVIWNLIRRCNLTCKHCYAFSADHDYPGELSTQQVFDVVVAALRPGAPLFVTMAVAQVPMVLSSFLPTPGGAGLLELLTASLLRAGATDAAPGAVGLQGGMETLDPATMLDAGPGGGAGASSGSVAAAVLAWRLLTYYTRLVIGPALGGTALRKNAREPSAPPRHDASLDRLQ